MKISPIFQDKKLVFSLEIFPPKKNGDIASIYHTLDELASIHPDCISVTYGAGGTAVGNLTTTIASRIKHEYHLEPVAHLTCLHNSKERIRQTLEDLRANGIENILALRGDRNPDLPVVNDFRYASDLVEYIFSHYDCFHVAGACYPEAHPESPDLETDIMHLKHKVNAGVSHLITQLFFDNKDFYHFMYRLKASGIQVPVEAGIMPVINSKQIRRMVSMCGASLPAKFSKMISRYETNGDALFDAGIAYATEQIIDLIASGVDGIHLYTMNNPKVALRIYDNIKNILTSVNGK